jgi:ABC-type glycerol-3-phosphate transport system substrate-binding protein
MKIFKKLSPQKIFLTSLLTYLAIVPSGCTPSEILSKVPFIKPPAKQVELTYWGLFEPEEVFQPLVEEYQKENPNVKITYEQRAYSDLGQYKETLLTRLREGTGPDIFRLHETWIPQFAAELSPLPSEVMSAAEFSNSFYPVAENTLSYQSQLYALPLMYDGLMLFYNTQHFAEIGLTNPPADWEELRDAGVRLTKTNEETKRITRAGAALGTANNVAHFSDILGLMFAQSKISFPRDLTSAGARDALVFYANFVTKDKVWEATFPNSVEAFAQGKVSMIFAPSWRVFDIQNLNPGLDFATAAVPQIPSLPQEEGAVVNWASFWAEGVNLDSENAAAAWAFLQFLSEPENLRLLYSEEAKLREFGEPYSRKDLGSVLLTNDYLAPLIDGAPTAASSIIADASGNDIYVDAVAEAVNGVLQGKDVDQILTTLKTTIERLGSVGQ